MTRLFSVLFLFTFSISAWSQQEVFQGRIDMGRDLASFEASPPVLGTLYLLTGSAAVVRIVSQDPFTAEVDFVQSEWQGEDSLVAHKALLRFDGPGWAKIVAAKKPRQGGEAMVYPYRKIQVAALAEAGGFRVVDVPVFF